ncbi:MAG: acyl carrier protein [Candidatus Woesearchaeota archaeon]
MEYNPSDKEREYKEIYRIVENGIRICEPHNKKVEIKPETPIRDYLDSLAMLDFAMYLEETLNKKYGKKFTVSDEALNNIKTVEDVVNTIYEKIREK